VSLRDVGKNAASGLRWSPDGKNLAFSGEKRPEPRQLFVFHSQDGHITKILDEGECHFWSPDGKWISYAMEKRFKTRPEGVLWEMNVEEALAKLAK